MSGESGKAGNGDWLISAQKEMKQQLLFGNPFIANWSR